MYYITISNGLLDGDHQKKMGSAVWQFMWCLDKITKIDSNGLGWVFGGKPIKLEDIKGASRITISRNLNKLEKLGYLKLIHTPYGISIRVCKAKKRFNKIDKPVGQRGLSKMITPVIKSDKPLNKNDKPNKILQLDITVDTIVAEATEWSFLGEIKKLKEGNRRDFKIIELYWRKKGWVFRNREQFNAALKRELRAANTLKGYEGVEIARAIDYCIDKYPPDGWTLETVFKRIQDLFNKKI